jgi:hypothetical protein
MSVVSTREKIYYGINPEDPDGPPVVVGSGHEITKEIPVCPGCAGVLIKTPVPLDLVQLKAAAEIRFDHARRCDGEKTRVHVKDGKDKTVPCAGRCVSHREWFYNLPSPTLNRILREPYKQGSLYRSTVALLTLDRMMDRTLHTSKRAQADSAAAMYVLRGYEETGATL